MYKTPLAHTSLKRTSYFSKHFSQNIFFCFILTYNLASLERTLSSMNSHFLIISAFKTLLSGRKCLKRTLTSKTKNLSLFLSFSHFIFSKFECKTKWNYKRTPHSPRVDSSYTTVSVRPREFVLYINLYLYTVYNHSAIYLIFIYCTCLFQFQ